MPALLIVSFGEILWDCLPRGLFLGGAPYNVACHLARLGRPAALISAVGADFLGDEARRRALRAGVDLTHLAQTRDYPTGTVQVSVDSSGRATYEFAAPAAWDFIPVSTAGQRRAGESAALVYGSLATRASASRAALDTLLAVPGPLKIFDVNLRPPHDEHARLLALACGADVVKLNVEELAALSGRPFAPSDDPLPLLQKLRDDTGVTRWCLTLGDQGAAWWDGDCVVRAAAPAVSVRDTVGAGDAFLAALVDGLTRLPSLRQTAPSPAQIQPLLARACRLGAFVAASDGACPEYRAEQFD
jgi:fructokinase